MKRVILRMLSLGTIAAGALLAAPGLTAGEKAMAPDAQAVFESLKGMAGTWSGEFDNPETGGKMEAVHVFEVSAAGTVVMETMAPGTEHEMINMYHLDGEDLLLTHYCAGGNQPQMRLDREASTDQELIFDYSGGTNLDPAKDPHIHSAKLEMKDENTLGSYWTSWNAGKEAMKVAFHLTREK